MIFQEVMPCSGRSKRSSASIACGLRKELSAQARCVLQAAGRGRGQEQRAHGRDAPIGSWAEVFAQNLRGAEATEAFRLLRRAGKAFSSCRRSARHGRPRALNSGPLSAQSKAIRCRSGRVIRLLARHSRAEYRQARTNPCPNACKTRRTWTAPYGAHTNSFPQSRYNATAQRRTQGRGSRRAFGVWELLFLRYGDDRKQADQGCVNCFSSVGTEAASP